MADAYHTLHLTSVHPSKRALAIRAVRAALAATGGLNDEQVWEQSTEAVYAVLRGEGPVGLVRDLEATVLAAKDAFYEALDGDAAAVEYDLALESEDSPLAPDDNRSLTIMLGGHGQPLKFSSDESSEGEGWTRKQIEQQFVAPTPAGFDPSYPAARTALVLMAATDGKAAPAWYYAKALGCATEDVELWVEVGNLIAETFGFETAAQADE